jgi:hypothetical protein
MNKIRTVAIVAIALLLGAVGLAPRASATTFTLNFTATDFQDSGGGAGTGPYTTVNGQFVVDFDLATPYTAAAGHVLSYSFTTDPTTPAFGFSDAANTLLLDYTPPLAFTLSTLDGTSGSVIRPFDWVFGIFAGQFLFGYVDADGNSYFTFNVTAFGTTATVTPVPGSVLLLLTSLVAAGAVGALRRSRIGRPASLAA